MGKVCQNAKKNKYKLHCKLSKGAKIRSRYNQVLDTKNVMLSMGKLTVRHHKLELVTNFVQIRSLISIYNGMCTVSSYETPMNRRFLCKYLSNILYVSKSCNSV